MEFIVDTGAAYSVLNKALIRVINYYVIVKGTTGSFWFKLNFPAKAPNNVMVLICQFIFFFL